jgi:hypothetical protein
MIVAAPGSSMREPTAELVARHLGRGIPIKTTAGGNWSGVSSAKAATAIGFKAHYGWESQLQI